MKQMANIEDLKQLYPYPSVSFVANSCSACYYSEVEKKSTCKTGEEEETCKISCYTGNYCHGGMGYCKQNQYVTARYEFPAFETFGNYCLDKDEFIYKSWTAELWNKYHTALHRGEDFTGGKGYLIDAAFSAAGYKNTVGSHGNGSSIKYNNANISKEQVIKGNPIKADNYNALIQRLQLYSFDNQQEQISEGKTEQILPPQQVKKDDLITKYKAMVLKDGYQKAKFSPSLCDFCISGAQTFCGCACSCPCSCSCGCSCDCSSANGGGSIGVSADGKMTIIGIGYGGVTGDTLNNTTTKVNAANAINSAIKNLQGTSASVSVSVKDSNGKDFTISGITANTPTISDTNNLNFSVSNGGSDKAPGSGTMDYGESGEGDFTKLTGNTKCMVYCEQREIFK